MAKDRIRLVGDWPTWGPEAKHACLSRGGEEVQVLVVPVDADSTSALDVHRDDVRRMTHADDPGVLRLLLATEMGGRTVRVYEAFEGCSLAHLQDGRLPVRVAVEASAAVARALAAVQGGAPGEPERVVHPGPRPRDVLLDARGEIKVAGFRRIVDGVEPGWASPDGYQPPDGSPGELRGSYGLGALLVTLLSGEQPARAGTSPAEHADVVRRALLGVMARPGSPVPDGLVQLLRRCLAATPQERPSLSDVGAELDAISRRMGGPDLRTWSSARVGAELQRAGLGGGPPVRRGGQQAAPAESASNLPSSSGAVPATDDAPDPAEETVEVARPGMIPVEAEPTESVDHPEPTETAAMPLRPPAAAEMANTGAGGADPGLGALGGIAESTAAGPALGDLRAVPHSAAAPSSPVHVGEDAVAGQVARRVGLGVGAVVFLALAVWALAQGRERPDGPARADGTPAPAAMASPPPVEAPTLAPPVAAPSAGEPPAVGTGQATPPAAPVAGPAATRPRSASTAPTNKGPRPSAAAVPGKADRDDVGPIRIPPPRAEPVSEPEPDAPPGPAPAPAPDVGPSSEPRGETGGGASPPSAGGFRVEFHSEDPTVTMLEVRCRQGRGDGATSVVLPDAGEGACKVTGRRDGLSLVATVRLTGPATFRCFEDGSRSCR